MGRECVVTITATGKHHLVGRREGSPPASTRPAPLPRGAVSGLGTWKATPPGSSEELEGVWSPLPGAWLASLDGALLLAGLCLLLLAWYTRADRLVSLLLTD